MSAVRKKKPTLEQQINEDGIRFLGKHISREKALALMVVTTLACAMPIVLGLSLIHISEPTRPGNTSRMPSSA